MIGLRSKAHGGAVAAARAGSLVIGAAGVPGETQEYGPEAAVVVVILLFEEAGDLVVDLLVVGPRGVHNLGRCRRGQAVVGVEPESETSGGGGGRQIQPGRR